MVISYCPLGLDQQLSKSCSSTLIVVSAARFPEFRIEPILTFARAYWHQIRMYANFGAQNSLRWRELVHKAPPCGRLSTWADFTKHLNARLPRKRPSETKADQLAHAIVSSQARADMTCVALYSGGARYLRPNVYSAQVVRDQFEPAPMRLWDPVW